MRYLIAQRDGTPKEVWGHAVAMSQMGHSFAVHHNRDDTFSVTHLGTGCRLDWGYTAKDAIKSARERIRTAAPGRLDECVQMARESGSALPAK